MVGNPRRDHPVDRAYRAGRRAWGYVGIVVLSVIIYVALAALSGLVIPLVIATVIGALFVPLVDRLAGFLPRKAAALTVLVGLLIVGFGSVAIAVNGVIDQAPEIRIQLASGIESVREWLGDAGIEIPSGTEVVDGGEGSVTEMVPGLTSVVGSIFSSAGSFVAGTAVSIFLLFYLLADWKTMTDWVETHGRLRRELGPGVVDNAVWSVRRYFSALTVTSLATAIIIGTVAALIGVPLAFTIALVTFITSYVPYVGAFVSGAFAVLIALGAGGIEDAIVILAVVLVVQIVVQPMLQNRMTASELGLHPIVSFGSTIVGGAIAGVLGATLSAPIVATIIRINGRRKHHEDPGHLEQTATETEGQTP